MKRAGIYHEFIDHGVTPADDLFRHANGSWLEKAEIPADKAHWGAFYELQERVDKQLKTIVEEISAKSSDELTFEERLIRRVYESFMDEGAIEAYKPEDVYNLVEHIEKSENLSDLFKLSAEVEKLEGESFFTNYISYDDKNSRRMIAHFAQGGLILPDREYYLNDEHAEVRAEYLKYIDELSKLFKISIDAGKVLSLESKIAGFSWDQVELRESELNYNIIKFKELAFKTPNIKFEAFLTSLNVELNAEAEVNEGQPSFFKALNTLLESESLDVLKNWLKWSLIDGVAPYLNKSISERSFEFWGKVINGLDEEPERWRRGLDLVEECVGEALGKIYIKKHYPAEVESKMESLISNLLEAYRLSIKEAGWMSESTKSAALTKLDKFNPKVGAPKVWRDYADLDIENSRNLLSIIKDVNAWYIAKEYSELEREVDRDRWLMTPQTVNAYYNPSLNEIVFPAAFLQEPFFFKDADDAVNYGSIGAVIGHEIGHGFDDQGAKYDGDGNMVSWWSEEDLENFRKLTGKLIAQFDGLKPSEAPEHKVNGALTVGENIGDLVGLSVAHKAYSISVGKGEITDEIEGYTSLQRFFFGWAGSWREKSRKEALINSLMTDPHAPSEFRCNNIAANLDSYYEAFDVKPGSKSYIEPERRVRIW